MTTASAETATPTAVLGYLVTVTADGLVHQSKISFPLGADTMEYHIGVCDEHADGFLLTLWAIAGQPPKAGKIQRLPDRVYWHGLHLLHGQLVPDKGGTRHRRGHNAPRSMQFTCVVEPIPSEGR